ncbi:glycosyltransferase family 2 protein [cf. Phormidesmis sp. LEGE 11477]|uniref:glycosyltransferase family 2 protein n=1 Tax=cf. Phormidesmis sp. LEGE 11477 TaxID=1828680 RepID=UPI001881668B|nr:glycosyltransferase family 2 protein [cf. Phormidesmis sp. LEGE 11477]MBE9060267.1 glycosyltransferase family 2 protein [cf. Phormidesmis sp. LEGE 11477]
MTNPFFSVIIPVHNREILITRTLDSVLSQEYKDYEIIVIDDGSIDRTSQVVEGYDSRIKLIRQQNKGPGQARNLGIKQARGKYVAFLDSDDFWFPWTLSVYKRVIEKTQASFLSGSVCNFYHEQELKEIRQTDVRFRFFSDYLAASRLSIWILPSATAIQTQLLRKSGGFTNKSINGEDSDLWLKLGVVEGFVSIDMPVISAYRRHANSATASRDKTFQGSYHLVAQENSGQYPGEASRKIERLEILTRHVRPVSLACLRQGDVCNALRLYISTFVWNSQLMRFKYLLVFPILVALSWLRKSRLKLYKILCSSIQL